jgi:hypothetical protein
MKTTMTRLSRHFAMTALVAGLSTGCAAHSKPEVSAPLSGSGSLSKDDIMTGMAAAKEGAMRCFERFGVPGIANVRLTIGAGGEVVFAQVSGDLEKHEEGRCVELMVYQLAHFPPNSGGLSLTVSPWRARSGRRR